MRILYDSRWISPHGIGRVASEYRDRLRADYDLVELTTGPKPSRPGDFLFTTRQFKQHEADVFVTPGYNGSPLIGRQVFFIHDLIHLSIGERGRLIKTLYLDSVIRWAARMSRVVTVSQASANEIGSRWPEVRANVRVIENGVSRLFQQCADARRSERDTIVLFGNERWHKNLPNMLTALSQWQRCGDAGGQRIAIIKGGDVARSLIASLDLRNVDMLDAVSDAELAALLQRGVALLFCSLHEGFGLPVVEALSAGCPVIASDISVLMEIAPNGCVFVDPRDVGSITAGIGVALTSSVPESLSEEVLARFDWDRGYSLLREEIGRAAV